MHAVLRTFLYITDHIDLPATQLGTLLLRIYIIYYAIESGY